MGVDVTLARVVQQGTSPRRRSTTSVDVVPDDALMARAVDLAKRLAALPVGPVRDLRRIFARPDGAGLNRALTAETEATVRGFLDPETVRRVSAFG